jgi:hypothetical protein
VENDDWRYRFAIDTGFLAEATIAERGTATLRDLHTEVDAKEFVPAEPDPDLKDDSAQLQRTAWRDGLEYARQYAFTCLAEQDDAGKLDDARLEVWKNVLADPYERWFPNGFANFAARPSADIDKFVDWLWVGREAAHGDATQLEALEVATKECRDKLEAETVDYVDRFAKSLALPDVKIASALGDRGLEAERDVIRAAGRKALVEPLLKLLDEGVAKAAHAGESK